MSGEGWHEGEGWEEQTPGAYSQMGRQGYPGRGDGGWQIPTVGEGWVAVEATSPHRSEHGPSAGAPPLSPGLCIPGLLEPSLVPSAEDRAQGLNTELGG